MPDSSSYQDKKAFFNRMLTVYGRKPVLEALQDQRLQCYALHLAESNRDSGIVAEIHQLAEARGIAIKRHNRAALARISRNGKQDQGVAADILCPQFQSVEDFLQQLPADGKLRLLALDGITNPQNLGMIIRSATAGNIDGIVLSQKGNAALGPLVIKASVGTVYGAPLLLCEDLRDALANCQQSGFELCALRADATQSLFGHRPAGHCLYILGNETEGVSAPVDKLADTGLAIPMRGGVESLNVAVTASLIAYADQLGAEA